VSIAETVCGAGTRCGEPREALGENPALASKLRANEAANGDSDSDAPAEARQIGKPADVTAVNATGVGAADRASGGRGDGRHHDGQVIEIEDGMDEATPSGSAQQIERKQYEAPET